MQFFDGHIVYRQLADGQVVLGLILTDRALAQLTKLAQAIPAPCGCVFERHDTFDTTTYTCLTDSRDLADIEFDMRDIAEDLRAGYDVHVTPILPREHIRPLAA